MAEKIHELCALIMRDSGDLFRAVDKVGPPFSYIKGYVHSILKFQLDGVVVLSNPNPDMFQFLLILENAVSVDYDFKAFLAEYFNRDGLFWPFFFWISQTRFKINFLDHARHRIMCLTSRQCRENRRYYRNDLVDHEFATRSLLECVEMWDKLTASMDSFRLKYFPDDIWVPKEMLDFRSFQRKAFLLLAQLEENKNRTNFEDRLRNEQAEEELEETDEGDEEEEVGAEREEDSSTVILDDEDDDGESVILADDEESSLSMDEGDPL